MGFQLQGIVGPSYLSDGTLANANVRVARDGSLVTQESHASYWEQWARGNVWYDNIPVAGIVITGPQVAAGVVCPQLFVPLGGTNSPVLEVVRLNLTYVSGNNVPGGFGFYRQGPVSAAATGGLILTLVTAAAPVNAKTFAAAGSWHAFYVGQSTFTGNPVYCRSSKISMLTGVAATAVAPFTLSEEYYGDFGIPNGYLVSFNTVQANGTATFSGGFVTVELPS